MQKHTRLSEAHSSLTEQHEQGVEQQRKTDKVTATQ
jgi:hypothetical protein